MTKQFRQIIYLLLITIFCLLKFSMLAYADYTKIVQKDGNMHTVYVLNQADSMQQKLGYDPRTNPSRKTPAYDATWIWENGRTTSARYYSSDDTLRIKWRVYPTATNGYTGTGPHLNTPNTNEYVADSNKWYRLYTRFKVNVAGRPIRVGYETIAIGNLTTTGDWQTWEWYGKASGGDAAINDFIWYIEQSTKNENLEIQISNIDVNEEKYHYDQNHNWTGYTVTQNPTCTTGGTRYRDCRDCGYREWSKLA